MRGRHGVNQSRALRVIAVLGIAAAPFAAVEAEAAVTSGPARANGPGVAFENSGGNVEMGKGHSESKVTHGDKQQKGAPAAPGLNTLSTPTPPPVAPAADKTARAKALVDAARARAQAQVDAARQQAAEAVAEAKQQAEEARARSDAQSHEAQSRSYSSYSSDDD